MESILYIDRVSGKHCIEKVYGSAALNFLYGNDIISRIFAPPLLHFLAKYPFISALYGFWQKSALSRKKIRPFIKNFDIDSFEFLENVDSFQSFNDFFIRKLKSEARPIASGDDVAIIPADGRYYFYPNIAETDGFIVKDQKFSLSALLDDEELAKCYSNGTMIIARLCPTDYHRFHFPCDCNPSMAKMINGWLYSVNPIAIEKNINIFTQNKRSICQLQTERFGKVLFLEIGATNVGSIHQTFKPNELAQKGDEKGYFSFGASSLIILFEPNKIILDADLLKLYSSSGNSKITNLEIKCLMGQSLGKALRPVNEML